MHHIAGEETNTCLINQRTYEASTTSVFPNGTANRGRRSDGKRLKRGGIGKETK